MGGIKKLSTETCIMERVNPAAENRQLTATCGHAMLIKFATKKTPQFLKATERRKITQTKRQNGLKSLCFTQYTALATGIAAPTRA